MACTVSPKLSLSDLLAAAGVDALTDLAAHAGVSYRTVQRWARDGGVPARSADEAACAVGLNPISVWGREWELVG